MFTEIFSKLFFYNNIISNASYVQIVAKFTFGLRSDEEQSQPLLR